MMCGGAMRVPHHVNLGDAVDALHLHVDAYRDGCT